MSPALALLAEQRASMLRLAASLRGAERLEALDLAARLAILLDEAGVDPLLAEAGPS